MNQRLIAPLLLVLLAGCGDALSLQEKPKTFLSEQQFFRNAADAEAALLAAYEPFQDNSYYQLRWVTDLVGMADYANGRGSYEPGAAYAFDQTAKDRLWAAWSSMYRCIDRANLVLARVPDIEMDATRKQQILGEASFVRALNYYNLVRYWGGVPLRLEPSQGFESLAQPRASEDAVYQQIVDDLTFAEANLPDDAPNGRATRWAATTLLADLYLGREQWTEAADKAKQVMDSGRFSLVQVTVPADFDKIFGPQVEKSAGEIFDIPFISQVPYGMELPAVFNTPGPGYGAREYRAIFADKDSFLFSWDPNDLRYQFDLYVGADTAYLTPEEPQRFKKFTDPSASDRQGHGNDFPIVRYADALLIYAEASAMANGGPTAASYDAVNRIRRRAYGRPLDAPAPGVDVPAGLSLDAFRDAVIQERAYEFLVEGKRYWDLKRSGKLAAAIQAVGEPYDPKYMLFPLPQEEIDANDSLTLADQNPGW